MPTKLIALPTLTGGDGKTTSVYRPRRCHAGLHHGPPSVSECSTCSHVCQFAPAGTAEKVYTRRATKMFLRLKGGVARAARYQAAMQKGGSVL